MADINKVAEHYPAVRDFRLSDLIGFRGDVLSYWANMDMPSFSTDGQGFRHSTLRGKALSVVDCISSPRYGIVLGASNMFGAGLAGNENTLASRLAERFDFPFANATMPGANSRNLYSLLIGLMAGAGTMPAAVVLSVSGDLGNFCEAGFVDPIFGSPNHMQIRSIREKGLSPDRDLNFERLLVFTSLWISAMATLCGARKVPLVLVHQASFFEKTGPSAVERECRLGEPAKPNQKRLFANLRKYSGRFYAKREELAKKFKLPLAGLGLTDQLGFIDEFHLDAEGTRVLSDAVGDALEPILKLPN